MKRYRNPPSGRKLSKEEMQILRGDRERQRCVMRPARKGNSTKAIHDERMERQRASLWFMYLPLSRSHHWMMHELHASPVTVLDLISPWNARLLVKLETGKRRSIEHQKDRMSCKDEAFLRITNTFKSRNTGQEKLWLGGDHMAPAHGSHVGASPRFQLEICKPSNEDIRG